MIRATRITTKTWHEILDDFVGDADLVDPVIAVAIERLRPNWNRTVRYLLKTFAKQILSQCSNLPEESAAPEL